MLSTHGRLGRSVASRRFKRLVTVSASSAVPARSALAALLEAAAAGDSEDIEEELAANAAVKAGESLTYFDNDVLESMAAKYAAIPKETSPEKAFGNGDILITTLVQAVKGDKPIYIVIYNFTKKIFIDVSIFKNKKGDITNKWRANGFVPTKGAGNTAVRKLIKEKACHCTMRGFDSEGKSTRVEAVSEDYVSRRLVPSHILFFYQQVVDSKLKTRGFVYAKYEKHILEDGSHEKGMFIDIICSQTQKPTARADGTTLPGYNTQELLSYAINFPKYMYDATFVDLHSVAHVIPFYLKQGFEFRKDCRRSDYGAGPILVPSDYDASPITAHYAHTRAFPGCPFEVFEGSRDGAVHEPVYRAIRALNATDKGYVIRSNPACKAVLTPAAANAAIAAAPTEEARAAAVAAAETARKNYGIEQGCMDDGIHMTRCLVDPPAAAAGNARRTARRANRKRRSTRRRR
jgi:hypothetical protein